MAQQEGDPLAWARALLAEASARATTPSPPLELPLEHDGHIDTLRGRLKLMELTEQLHRCAPKVLRGVIEQRKAPKPRAEKADTKARLIAARVESYRAREIAKGRPAVVYARRRSMTPSHATR
jgi:hypothetical protein